MARRRAEPPRWRAEGRIYRKPQNGEEKRLQLSPEELEKRREAMRLRRRLRGKRR